MLCLQNLLWKLIEGSYSVHDFKHSANTILDKKAIKRSVFETVNAKSAP